ncbi:lipoprotein [Spirochaetia bacterium]|nr:lipoprotein [Spirochaetia bacterium]
MKSPTEAAPPEETPRPPAEDIGPITPENLLGSGQIPASSLISFFLNTNPRIDTGFIEELVLFYTEEAAIEGINHDVAFAQMCLETGFLRFGGLVTLEMNNFCGLGATGPGQPGEYFSTPRLGVRAHIQHLKAYATTEPLRQALIDPRYRWVRYGSAPTLAGLSGAWASDKEYDLKIRRILKQLYTYSRVTEVAQN